MLFICFGIVWFGAWRFYYSLSIHSTDWQHRSIRFQNPLPGMIRKWLTSPGQATDGSCALHDLINLLPAVAGNQEFSILTKNIAHGFAIAGRKRHHGMALRWRMCLIRQRISPFFLSRQHQWLHQKSIPWLLCRKSGETIHLNREDNVLNYYNSRC